MNRDDFTLIRFLTKREQDKFWKKSANIVRHINDRAKKLGFSGGRLTLEEGREILGRAVKQPCKYCAERILVSTMSLDHPTPLSRGGSPIEVECCCLRCNREKGELTSDEFVKFNAAVAVFPEVARKYIHKTMRSGGSLARMQRTARFMAGKIASQSVAIEALLE